MANDEQHGASLKKFLKIGAVLLAVLTAVFVAASFLYWFGLKNEPQYSLALIVDAARRNDQAAIADLIDSDALVEDLLPQVIDKAVEMYGRGLPVNALAKASVAATPLMPAVKERARSELPDLIRRETVRFGDTPFPLLVLGSRRYLAIRIDGGSAIVRSKDPDHTTEIRMIRIGERWKVVGIRDEKLAGEIARQIGQEIIALVLKSSKDGGSHAIDSLIEQLRKAIK